MRLLILSDLHREVWLSAWKGRNAKWADPFPVIDPEVSRPDLVILAGDIDEGTRGVTWADAAFAGLPVIYVSGNHEGYGHNRDVVGAELAVACQATGHMHYLDRQKLVINGVRILGATLWSDFRLHGKGLAEHRKDVARRMVNDYQRIRATKANRLLRPDDTQRWHLESVKWLKKCIDAPFDGATIVVTHMAPSVQSISPGFATDPLSAAYASRLDDLVEQVDLWVHGHTHQSLDYRLGKARVVCNPLGYSGSFQVSRAENVDFDPNFVVEIP